MRSLLGALLVVALAARSCCEVETDFMPVPRARKLQAFHSERVTVQLQVPGQSQDFTLVVSDIGPYPFGTIIRATFQVWDHGMAAAYDSTQCPRVGSTEPPQDCRYLCYPLKDYKFPPATAIMVERGPDDAYKCSFTQKLDAAQKSGASVVIIHSWDDAALTMDTGSGDVELGIEQTLTLTAFFATKAAGDQMRRFLTDHGVTSAHFVADLRNVAPERQKLDVTLWRSEVWDCGKACESAAAFLSQSDFAATMAAWVAGGAATFRTRFLLQSCQSASLQPGECQTFCIRGGRYCSVDPDGNPSAGQTGRDAIVQAVVYKCVEEVTSTYSKPEAALYYQTEWATACMRAKVFGLDCSLQAFERSIPTRLWSPAEFAVLNITANTVSSQVRECVERYAAPATIDLALPVPFFDEDARLRGGYHDAVWGDVTAVAIDPTLIVGANAYRGIWQAESVLRYICSRFPDGEEPAQCRFRGVSNCDPGSDGYVDCRSPANVAAHKTRCFETFSGYTCTCDLGYITARGSDASNFTCVGTIPCGGGLTCGGDQVCLNHTGKYECVTVVEMCTATHNYGGCYVSPTLKDAGGLPLTACQSRVPQLLVAAAAGETAAAGSMPAFECNCDALPCHSGDGGRCQADCAPSQCRDGGAPGRSVCSAAPSAAGGAVAAGIAFGMLAFAALAGALVYVSRRQRQSSDLTAGLMHQVTALREQLARRGGGAPGALDRNGYVDLKDADDDPEEALAEQPP